MHVRLGGEGERVARNGAALWGGGTDAPVRVCPGWAPAAAGGACGSGGRAGEPRHGW